MSITVRYFASLQELTGISNQAFALEHALPVRMIWESLHPTIALPDNILIAINLEYAGLEDLVSPGDELAFFPPVTGG
jgi:molybdopterin synthase sulfur carrier subunit